MSQRYAVYLTPSPDHPLWSAGCDWLGRDPGWTEPGHAPEGRRQAWRYGFHSTLKAPMRLVPGAREQDLWSALEALADRHGSFDLPTLQVAGMDSFLALRPVHSLPHEHPLQQLADACVRDLDDLRAPLSLTEVTHRLGKSPLDAQQQSLMARWGYPHVLQCWRWHYTLSDRLADAGQHHELLAQAREHFAHALVRPQRCEALSLFVEPVSGAPLRLVHRFALARRPAASSRSSRKIESPSRKQGAVVLV
jgi:hypothetical protein